MTKQSFTFSLNYLKSCAICAATEQTRYYLNGVAVQYDGKDLVAVATDGHRMVCFNIDFAKEGETIEPFSMIIPKAIIDGIKTDKTLNNVSLILATKDMKPYLQYGHNMFLFDPIDGIFPEWQRVIPSAFSNVPAQFNPKYLMDFAKITKLWTKGDRITVTPNGEGPCYVDLNIVDIQGFGILMPLREKSSPATHAPLWATGFRIPANKDVAA